LTFIGCGAQPKNTTACFAAHGAIDGGEHAGLAGLDQLELAEAELVLG
jgi:hypothetical protein